MTEIQDTEKVLLDALRLNANVLNEVALRYGIGPGADRSEDERPRINCPSDVRRLLGPEMASLAQEQLRVLLLDNQSKLVGQRVVYQGTVSECGVRAAEVFRPAVIEAVPSVIVVHNHPSGDPTPSGPDAMVTRRLAEAGELLDIELLDHVVIGRDGAKSLKELGLMTR